MTTLTPAELGPFVDEHYHRDYLRLETRPSYGNPNDQAELRAYLNGEQPETDLSPFHRGIRQHVDAGQTWRVLHAVDEPLTDYLKYEFEWGYIRGLTLGEQIRICDLSPQHRATGDLLILDGEHVLRMNYTAANSFTGADVITETAAEYIAFAEASWAAATTFTSWWSAHPQYHRNTTAA